LATIIDQQICPDLITGLHGLKKALSMKRLNQQNKPTPDIIISFQYQILEEFFGYKRGIK
jgi:hypothetical protein